jgi:hypothetical protein
VVAPEFPNENDGVCFVSLGVAAAGVGAAAGVWLVAPNVKPEDGAAVLAPPNENEGVCLVSLGVGADVAGVFICPAEPKEKAALFVISCVPVGAGVEVPPNAKGWLFSSPEDTLAAPNEINVAESCFSSCFAVVEEEEAPKVNGAVVFASSDLEAVSPKEKEDKVLSFFVAALPNEKDGPVSSFWSVFVAAPMTDGVSSA